MMASQGFGQGDKPGRTAKARRGYTAPVLFLVGLAALAGAFLFFINRDGPGQTYSFHHMAMDTNIELRLQAESRARAEAVKEEVFAEMVRLESLLSRSLPESDVARVNAAAGREAVAVSPETMAVTQTALEYALMTEGAFDPTVAPLLDAWGFLEQEYRLPAPDEIEAALSLVGFSLLELDLEGGTLFLPRSGMSLDLGGIAKGYIVDRGLAVLVEAGIEHAFLNAGGDIGLIGTRPDGDPWRIGVRHPRENKNFAVIPFSGGAVVTSGDYQRFFEEDGVRYHHILDPSNGYPAGSLASVTIAAPTAVAADALSTAVFVLGPEAGLALVEQLPGIEAVFVTAEMDVLVSTGLKDIISLQQR